MKKSLNQEIQILINRYKQGDYKNVLKKCSTLLKENPRNDFLWNLSGLSFQQIGNNKDAITSFQNAINHNQKNHSAKNNLAISYKNINEYSKATKLLKELIEEYPNYINAYTNLANLQNETYFFDEALINFNKALDINKNSPEIHLNISNVFQSLNKIDEAKNHLNQALKINKNFTIADRNLSLLNSYKNGENENHLKTMLDKLDNSEYSDTNKIFLNFGLGKAFEDRKDYNNSFKHFELGNNLKYKKTKNFIKKFQKKSHDIKKYFKELNLNEIPKFKDEGKMIFITGLPRSGTTLLEKIISSHSKVESISEVGFIFREITGSIFSDNIIDENKINSFINQNLEKKFNNFLKSYNVKSNYIIDKSLNNFWYIGFIKIFFPNSKIIHSFRNPKDNCLSIYKNLFPTNDSWLYSQEDLGEYYLIYNDLMKFWNEIFEGGIYNCKYEELINDHTNKTKEIIKFCSLDWEENCLNHQDNKNPIKTLSINQANQKVYKTSINSSKFYENKLSKLYSIIDNLI